jgi:transposase-like protein
MKEVIDATKEALAEEIIGKLREAEVLLAQGKKVPEVSRILGVTEQTYFRWRKEYGGLKKDQARRLKELEHENARLKKAVADLSGHAEVRASSEFAIQMGENWWFPEDAAWAIAMKVSDFAMLDIMKIGGITGWMRAACQDGKPSNSE